MKAVVVHQYGGPEVLEFEDYPDPIPGAGEVLVRVAATSVNPIDYKRRAGLTKDFYPLKFPGLIGVDMSGTVVKLGPGVTVSAKVVEAVRVPEVPVTVTIETPVVAVLVAVRVRTLEPVAGLVAKAACTLASLFHSATTM